MVAAMREAGLAHNSIATYVRNLKTFYNWCKVKDHVAPLPSQEGYMKSLAGLLAMHLNRNLLIDDGYAPDDLPVPSAIVVAPTGQGKTFLLRKMVKTLNLNLITVDCSTLVRENYKGVSLSQCIAGAMEEAKDENSFQQSVLFLDEANKLCRGNSQHVPQ